MNNLKLENLYAGIQISIYGLAGVFLVLILFFLITKGLFSFSKKLSD